MIAFLLFACHGKTPDTSTDDTSGTGTGPTSTPIVMMCDGGGNRNGGLYQRFVDAAGKGKIVTVETTDVAPSDVK